MAPVVTRRTIFGAKVEVTRGTDTTPTAAANAIVVYDLEVKPLDGSDSIERKPIVGHMSMETPISGLLQGKITCKTFLSGASAAGSAPDWFVLNNSCGFRETLTGSSARSRPASTDALTPCLSTYTWMDGHLYKVLGAAGNAKLMLEVGKPGTWEYEFTGIYSVPTLVTLPTASVAYTQHVAPDTFRGAGFTWTPLPAGAAHTPVLRKFEYDGGADVQLRPDANNASGNISAIIVDRTPTLAFTVEEPDSYTPAAGQNWWSNFTANTAGAISIGPIGTVAGRIWNLDMANVGLSAVEPAYENGMLVLNMKGTPATAAIAAGDDEFDLIFT